MISPDSSPTAAAELLLALDFALDPTLDPLLAKQSTVDLDDAHRGQGRRARGRPRW